MTQQEQQITGDRVWWAEHMSMARDEAIAENLTRVREARHAAEEAEIAAYLAYRQASRKADAAKQEWEAAYDVVMS